MYALDLLIEMNLLEIAPKLIALFANSKSDTVFELYYKGKVKEKEQKYEAALTDFDESLIIDPMFYKSMVAKASILINVPKFFDLQKAQELLLKALRHEEDPETMFYN